ncbi:hypothetical protein SRHO_G00224110 [Serrasalmus rhombeus]
MVSSDPDLHFRGDRTVNTDGYEEELQAGQDRFLTEALKRLAGPTLGLALWPGRAVEPCGDNVWFHSA